MRLLCEVTSVRWTEVKLNIDCFFFYLTDNRLPDVPVRFLLDRLKVISTAVVCLVSVIDC
jgi:hypothetical protein